MDLTSPLVSIPLFVALLFIIVSSPLVYAFTDDKIAPVLGVDFTAGGSPTRAGLIAHAAVAFGVMYAFLRAYSPTTSLY